MILRWNALAFYLGMAVLSLLSGLRENIGTSRSRARQFLMRRIHTLSRTLPKIPGVIVRIGECDTKDVKRQFRSELPLCTSSQVNTRLKDLLPILNQ